MIVGIVLTFLYIGSVIGAWSAGRYMCKLDAKKGQPDTPGLLAVFVTFCPIINMFIAVVGLVAYLSEGLSATGFYRLDKD